MTKKKVGDSMVLVSFIAGMFVAILSMTLFKFTITNYLVIFAGIFVLMIIGVLIQNASTKEKKDSVTDEIIDEVEIELNGEIIEIVEDVEVLENIEHSEVETLEIVDVVKEIETVE